MRTKITAAAGDNYAANHRAASEAFFTFTHVDAMAQLKLSAFAVCIQIIRDGRSAQANRFIQNLLDSPEETVKFHIFEFHSETLGVNPRAPQTLVSVDIADAAQNMLIEEKRFDAGAARANSGAKFLFFGFQWIEAEFSQDIFARAIL